MWTSVSIYFDSAGSGHSICKLTSCTGSVKKTGPTILKWSLAACRWGHDKPGNAWPGTFARVRAWGCKGKAMGTGNIVQIIIYDIYLYYKLYVMLDRHQLIYLLYNIHTLVQTLSDFGGDMWSSWWIHPSLIKPHTRFWLAHYEGCLSIRLHIDGVMPSYWKWRLFCVTGWQMEPTPQSWPGVSTLNMVQNVP